MQILRRMTFMILTIMLCVSGTVVAFAQSNGETLHNVEQELKQKAQEKQAISKEIEDVQNEMNSLYSYIEQNKKALEQTQKRMQDINEIIVKKKEEIVVLQDKIHQRKDVMGARLQAMQQDDKIGVLVNVFLESKSLDDFIQRASAVTALLSADQNILGAQEADLKQIEEDKKEIDRQEQILEEEQAVLAKQQQELDGNLQKRQETLTAMEEKYSQIDEEMAGIQTQLREAQEKIRKEQEEARARTASATAVQPLSTPDVAIKGKEMYVTSTAYSYQSAGDITAMGYNIRQNPNIKLIAVDPTVIPLGSKVWVEGYGVAIAGDTGGAIKGYKIDVVMPNNAQALQWGRRTVKIIVLE
jgi:3D (Asp-Asp-Asp) domain-containing protein/predicted  nucleic acid-binding Zn-ribbon protein